MNKSISLNWSKITDMKSNFIPEPRHGHRAISVAQLIIVFGGGGKNGILNEILVFHTSTNEWYRPKTIGDVPKHGYAAFGCAASGTKIIIFGGMTPDTKYCNDLYLLDASKWEWYRISEYKTRITGGYQFSSMPTPIPRIGHSFTFIKDRIYMFGGISMHDKENLTFLNDLYTLRIVDKKSIWDEIMCKERRPCPRESHSANVYEVNGKNQLIIYGGNMGYGFRLHDIWMLDTETFTWTTPKINSKIPLPRSLHTSVVIGNSMYVFGGIIQKDNKKPKWDIDNHLECFNFETFTWEHCQFDKNTTDIRPAGRAAHCAVRVYNNKMYVWSGRAEYYRKPPNDKPVLHSDMWCLTVKEKDKRIIISILKTEK